MSKKIKFLPLFLSVIAGMGHLWEGKDLKGLAIFSFFAVGAAGILEGTILWSGEGKLLIIIFSILIILVVWCYAFFDIFRLTYGPWLEKNRLKRSEHLRQGILNFLKNDYEGAESELLENLHLEAGDPESLFRLAVVCRKRGEFSRARRYLKALHKTDHQEKWRWESSQEEVFMRKIEEEEKDEKDKKKQD